MVTIPALSQVAADQIVNTLHFANASLTPDFAVVKAELMQFYDAWSNYRSSFYAWQQARVKFYNLSDAEPRVAVYDELLGLNALVATNGMPQEVALCVSYQGPRQAGQKQARRRGRIFTGPFSVAANNGVAGRPASALRTLMADSAENNLLQITGQAGWEWVVHSRVAPAASADTIVTDGWVDDSWDTQRRRGNRPSARTVFP